VKIRLSADTAHRNGTDLTGPVTLPIGTRGHPGQPLYVTLCRAASVVYHT
jgi:hypothetical protein